MELCLNMVNYSPRLGAPADVRELVRAAAEAGFDSVGLDLGILARSAEDGLGLADVRRALDDAGLSCWEVVSVRVGTDDIETMTSARAAAEAAGALGAPWMLTLVDAPAGAETTDRFGRCAEVAAAAGARLSLEFYPGVQVRTIAAALELCTAVGFERARVLVDTWHVFRGTDGWAEVEALPLDALAYVQFDDALPTASDDVSLETTTRRVWPGEGEFPLARFAEILRDRGFDGTVSVEVMGAATIGMDPRVYATAAMATTRPYWR